MRNLVFKKLPFVNKVSDASGQADSDLGLEQYLRENPLVNNLPLSPNGELSFHWGDWRESCHFQRELLRSEGKHEERLGELEEIFEELKMTPVWINNNVATKKLSLYDLYRSYMDPRIRQIWFDSGEKQFLIALGSEDGPYVPLKSMRWSSN